MVAAALVAGCASGTALPPRELPIPPSTSESVPVPTAVPVPTSTTEVAPVAMVDVADPARIRIPAIGVDAAVGPLELDAANLLPPPATNEDTGWWRAGPEPGEVGPAVIVGHVDSYLGPAVFFRLRQLVPGDEILVERVDGSVARFVVSSSEQYDKNAFPTDAVYGATPDAQLRLITCGGSFDRGDRRYLDNVVVYAHLAP